MGRPDLQKNCFANKSSAFPSQRGRFFPAERRRSSFFICSSECSCPEAFPSASLFAVSWPPRSESSVHPRQPGKVFHGSARRRRHQGRDVYRLTPLPSVALPARERMCTNHPPIGWIGTGFLFRRREPHFSWAGSFVAVSPTVRVGHEVLAAVAAGPIAVFAVCRGSAAQITSATTTSDRGEDPTPANGEIATYGATSVARRRSCAVAFRSRRTNRL